MPAAGLHEAIREIADPMALLDRIVQQALVLLPHADGASLEVLRDDRRLEYASAAGTLAASVGITLPVDQSLSGRAVLTGEVQQCDDARDDPRVNAEAVRRTGVVSMLCVPLSDRLGGVAVLKVSSRRPHAFSAKDLSTLRRLATFMDVSVRAASDLADATEDVLQALDADHSPELAGGSEPGRAQAARFVADVLTPGLAERAESAQLVRDVVAGERVTTVVQPIVDLRTRELIAVEALSRFPDSTGRPPDHWFRMAHRIGLGEALELLAIRRALALVDALPYGVRMAVNVSAETVLHPDFAAVMAAVPPDRLTVELTEHSPVADYDAVLAVLAPLRAAGARLSVDDTGTGYSGLAHIMRLLPEVIKLDRELTTGVHADPVRQALTTALVSFAERIGARVVAEGIEVEQEADVLRDLGVGFGQGYLLGRPGSVDSLVA